LESYRLPEKGKVRAVRGVRAVAAEAVILTVARLLPPADLRLQRASRPLLAGLRLASLLVASLSAVAKKVFFVAARV